MLRHPACTQEDVIAAFTSTLRTVHSCPGDSKVRTLQRMPAHFRAALALSPGLADALICVTRDLHVQGALLHLHAGVPELVRVGSRGRLRIELAAGVPLEVDVVVRHCHAYGLGVRFIAPELNRRGAVSATSGDAGADGDSHSGVSAGRSRPAPHHDVLVGSARQT